MDIIGLIIVGLIAGWLAGMFVRGGGFGLVGDIIVGIIGAVIGGYAFRWAGLLPGYGFVAQLIVATIGAIILLLVVRVLRRI